MRYLVIALVFALGCADGLGYKKEHKRPLPATPLKEPDPIRKEDHCKDICGGGATCSCYEHLRFCPCREGGFPGRK
jgi:hypothetical protein